MQKAKNKPLHAIASSDKVGGLAIPAVNYKIRTNSKLCKSKESDT